MTKEQMLHRAEKLIEAADGYADDERVRWAGDYWLACTLRDMADTLIEDADQA